MRRLIYPATRAVEHAAGQPGVRPIRLFPVLWPLWQVETSADLHERQDFEVIDHFVMRAIGEAGIRDRAGLVAFLNLPAGLVDRCLAFLSTIQQISVTGTDLRLTSLGEQSLAAGFRLVPTTTRLTVLIERQSARPLPSAYYGADVTVLDTPEIDPGQLADRSRFLRVFTAAPYPADVLRQIEQHPERADLNLHGKLRNLRQEGLRDGFLPSYLVETADHRVLAYTAAAEGRDEFFEQLCSETAIEHLIEAKRIRPAREVWTDWLATSATYGKGTLTETGLGWQVVMAAGAFGESPRIPLTRIGSYQFRDHHIIRVWCADAEVRRRALVERSLGIATLPEVTSVQDLEDRIERLAASLSVPAVSVAELKTAVRRRDDGWRARRLETLPG